MSKRIFVSADWGESFDSHSCDREVVDRIRKWKSDARYGVDITCTDDVHDSVTEEKDCRRCDIKFECGKCVEKSSVVIFVVGDRTSTKNAGSCDGTLCSPAYSGLQKKYCNKGYIFNQPQHWQRMSYLEYEITTAIINKKSILIVYNAAYHMESWIPAWYKVLCRNYRVDELGRIPFWSNCDHTKDCYQEIRRYLE